MWTELLVLELGAFELELEFLLLDELESFLAVEFMLFCELEPFTVGQKRSSGRKKLDVKSPPLDGYASPERKPL